jgi:hypothetical protein
MADSHELAEAIAKNGGQKMRYLNFVLIAILLAGCGTISSIRSGARLPESTSFAFRDDRPPAERQSRTDRSRYGKVLYFGDDRVTPSGPELLKASLESRLHAMLAGKTVSLSEFNVYMHEGGASLDPDRLSAVAASTPGGYAGAPFAGLLIRGVEKTRSDKTVRIQIKGKVGLAEFSSSTADTYRGRITEEDMQATLSKALDEATAQVQRVVEQSGNCSVNQPGCSLRQLSGG